MTSVRGYYNGSAYVAMEPVTVRPNQKVIITVLDDEFLPAHNATREELWEKLSALCGSAGKICPEGMDAQDYVNTLREERVF